MANDDFLGKGIKYPFTLNIVGATASSPSISVSEKQDHIRESIEQILGTSPGERVMLPEFGSRLRELLFEPNNDILKSLAKVYVADAIRRWEKRIIIKEVQVDNDPDEMLLNITISYTIIKDQTEGNLVYPFYIGQSL